MADDGWEARMAQRAAARAEVADRIDWEVHSRRLEAQAWAWVADMTLGEAVEDVRWMRDNAIACACIGPPGCCQYPRRQAEALVRGAHIAVKLIADRAAEQGAKDA